MSKDTNKMIRVVEDGVVKQTTTETVKKFKLDSIMNINEMRRIIEDLKNKGS